MWIKFDGKYMVVRQPEINKEVTLPYSVDRWFHIAIDNGKIYIDGKETEE
jgi:hypothetical protein